MVYFPEVFSNRATKFARLAIWLVTREAVVCPNLRDLFTARGKDRFTIDNQTYDEVPRIFITLFQNMVTILKVLEDTPASMHSTFWDKKTSESNKIGDWIDLVAMHASTVNSAKHLDIKHLLQQLTH